jgi:drug/metabolite transporter (DMT)-like permease
MPGPSWPLPAPILTRPSRLLLASAFLAVYVIWGSTYLAIFKVVAELPPFLVAGVRWIAAGAALYLVRRAMGDERPTLRHWRSAAAVGALLIVGGNGLVSYAEQRVPSGLTALLIAIVPVWIALLLWATTGARPTLRVGAGIALGVVGVAALVGPAAFGDARDLAVLGGIGVILLASFSWANGSLYSRRAALPKSPLLGAAMEMLAGGVLLCVVGLAFGEGARIGDFARASAGAWAWLAFLAVFGSIVAYSAYVWLLQVARPELVATYAFVNPVVAVVLGALLNAEAITPMTLGAAALIVVAVAIVVTAPRPPAAEAPPESASS